MSKRCGLPAVLFLVTAAGLIGCGGAGKTVNVEGVVTLDGKALAGATVTFWPAAGGGKAASGRTEEDGSFRLTTFRTDDGALPGEYKVTVTFSEVDKATEGGDPMQMDEKAKRDFFTKMDPAGRAKEKKGSKAIPEIYTDLTKTTLKETVPPPGKVEVKLRSGAR